MWWKKTIYQVFVFVLIAYSILLCPFIQLKNVIEKEIHKKYWKNDNSWKNYKFFFHRIEWKKKKINKTVNGFFFDFALIFIDKIYKIKIDNQSDIDNRSGVTENLKYFMK